jgi:hypothetical protein
MRKKKIDFFIDEAAMNIFNDNIEDIRKECDTYLESIAGYCEDNDVDIEDILPLISPGLKQKIYSEEIERNTLIVDNLELDFMM